MIYTLIFRVQLCLTILPDFARHDEKSFDQILKTVHPGILKLSGKYKFQKE
jgi:hypothetical protein